MTALGVKPGEPCDVDRGLGMAGADQHAAGAGDERKHVAGRHQRFGPVGRIDRHRDGARPVCCADPGRNPVLGLDRDGESGLVAAAVGARHRLEPELVGPVLSEREADQAAAVPGHEVDRVGCGHLRRDHEVALVLARFVVDQDEHPSVARLVDDRRAVDQRLAGAVPDQLFEAAQGVGGRIPACGAQFAQGVGVKTGGASQPGTADLAGVDDRFQLLDQGRAHKAPISHHNVMKSRNSNVPTVIFAPTSAEYT